MTETNFKHTDLGLIPHDWEVKTLEDYADILNGDRSERYPKDSEISYSGIPFINAGHIVNGQLDFSKMDYISIEKYNSMSGVKLKINDLLVCLRGSLGKNAKIDFEGGTVASSLCVIRPYAINPNYLSSILNSSFFDGFIKEENNGSSQPNLSAQSLLGFKCPLPPTLAEQERIAGALSSIDTLIGALNKQIEKKRHIKQGTIQQLLTGKKRLAGFTGKWKEVRLVDVAKLKSGYAFKSTTYSNIGTFKIITIANVQNGVLDMSDYNKIAEIPSNIQEHQILKEGDILVSMTGNVGRVCRVDCKNCLLNQRVGVFALKNTIDAEYLYVILNSLEFEKEMIGKGHGAAQPNIGSSDVESYCFVVPPTIAEQSAIAAVLSRMDTEIAALEQKRDKYIAIKSGMMQNLLTGKIRLV